MKLNRMITTIDTHTAGEPTRVVTGGIPYIPGASMQEKKNWMAKNEDDLRKMLMLEPRGHQDMFGAILTAPVSEDADMGIIYMDSSGYLDMCVHGSIGAVTAMVESGMLRSFDQESEKIQQVVLDTPAGKIYSTVHLDQGHAKSVTIQNVPSFLYSVLEIELNGMGMIPVSICYAGNYFAIVKSELLGLRVEQQHVNKLIEYGLEIRKKVNLNIDIRHPDSGEPGQVNLVEFYEETDPPRNVVIFGAGQADRSPCGTGTGAKMAMLHAQKKLMVGQRYPYHSIIGTEFIGEILEEKQMKDRVAIVPAVTGRAHIIGLQKFVIDDDDPFKYGFGFLKSA
ncbi:proline racemase [Desulfuromusa kysingii]|uniref:Proline racemase n=1 Tax=Desulfuromusa kysingii TaxID=37625 RepID=A0A1H4E0U8_9BACT|nr:proline racemase family protein [Desulfuromusa kysingii]SEA78399.1 proline racemase [Desulfuromusa kysingii]